MKKVIAVIMTVVVLTTTGMIFCYMAGRNRAEKACQQKIINMEEQYQKQLKTQNQLEDQTPRESKVEEDEQPEPIDEQEGDASQEQPSSEESQESPLDATYTLTGFEAVYQAYCTQDQLDAIKEAAAQAVRESTYSDIRTIACSSYTRIETADTRVTGYARLDDRAVLEITYSVRYGQPSAKISDYTIENLQDLEEVGVIRDDGAAETVTPAPVVSAILYAGKNGFLHRGIRGIP